MATSRYSPQLVEKVNSILANADIGALSRFHAAMAELWAENIPYKVVVHNGDLVVHVKNRGGLGVNAHNVHGTMKAVKQVGADPVLKHLRSMSISLLLPMAFLQIYPGMNASALCRPLTSAKVARLLRMAASHVRRTWPIQLGEST